MSLSKLTTEPIQTLFIGAVYDSYQEFEDASKSYSESTFQISFDEVVIILNQYI